MLEARLLFFYFQNIFNRTVNRKQIPKHSDVINISWNKLYFFTFPLFESLSLTALSSAFLSIYYCFFKFRTFFIIQWPSNQIKERINICSSLFYKISDAKSYKILEDLYFIYFYDTRLFPLLNAGHKALTIVSENEATKF